MSKNAKPGAEAVASTSNFIRSHVDADLAAGKYAARTWGGKPGPARVHAGAPLDAAKIRTRFPPEPNGYLHLGHAKSICLNFGLALHYGGFCHLRFDDTNPEKEEQEYVDSIRDAVQWLGFDWGPNGYFASDYFDYMYEAAQYLISAGHAYVDEQSAEEMRANRGTLTEPGKPGPWRNRPNAESLARFAEMREGKHADGAMVLRAKIDIASPNINLRDPVI
jgi:glutaminyl-tRNA synthetase